jgi:Flp pilus assembly protein TadG
MGQTPDILLHPCPPPCRFRGMLVWPAGTAARGGARALPGKDHGSASSQRLLRGQKGGAAEFALVLPLFLILWCAVVDFGLPLYAKGLITHASQEGARFGRIYP